MHIYVQYGVVFKAADRFFPPPVLRDHPAVGWASRQVLVSGSTAISYGNCYRFDAAVRCVP